jgi:hypothetical protein
MFCALVVPLGFVLLFLRVLVLYFQILYNPTYLRSPSSDYLQILRSPTMRVSPWEERWRDRWVDKFESRLLDSSSCLGCLI